MNRWDSRHLFGPLLLALLLLCWDLRNTCCSAQKSGALYIVEENKFNLPRSPDSVSYKMPLYQVKRSTVILDKLMYALQKYALHKNANIENQTELRANLPNRGTDAEGKVYWKCYFNPVSCFRRR